MPLNTAPTPLTSRPVGGTRPFKDTGFKPLITRSSTQPSIPGLDYMGPGGRNESFSGEGGGGGNRFGQRFNPKGNSTPVGIGGILGGGGPPRSFGRMSPSGVFTPRGSAQPNPGGMMPPSSPMNPRIPLNTTPTMPSPSAPMNPPPMNPGPVTPPGWGRSGNTGYNPYPGPVTSPGDNFQGSGNIIPPTLYGDNFRDPSSNNGLEMIGDPQTPPSYTPPRNMGQGLWNKYNRMY